jgi:hypothetical protein
MGGVAPFETSKLQVFSGKNCKFFACGGFFFQKVLILIFFQDNCESFFPQRHFQRAFGAKNLGQQQPNENSSDAPDNRILFYMPWPVFSYFSAYNGYSGPSFYAFGFLHFLSLRRVEKTFVNTGRGMCRTFRCSSPTNQRTGSTLRRRKSRQTGHVNTFRKIDRMLQLNQRIIKGPMLRMIERRMCQRTNDAHTQIVFIRGDGIPPKDHFVIVGIIA